VYGECFGDLSPDLIFGGYSNDPLPSEFGLGGVEGLKGE
jgi:hypothetical protein